MTTALTPLLPYIAVALLILTLYVMRLRRRDRANTRAHAEAVAQGLAEPPSLHPVVNAQRCIGSDGCAHACPEGALGLVGGKAVLVNAASCIGHGACRAACPVEAITLVFGTEKRGVDIPAVSPEFESNVPGLFIAGELGGMGLIRKATEQGRQAVEALRRRKGGSADLDLLIVGAGPAGLSAGLSAIEHKLRYRLIGQEDTLGGGDSALEAALALSEQPGTTVTLSYRSAAFSRVKEKNRLRVQQQAAAGRLQLLLNSRVQAIEPDAVALQTETGTLRLANQAVIVCAGGELPTPLLQRAGVQFATKYGTA